MNSCGRALNFTVEWKYPDDGTFGSKGGDGSWTGIVGELVDGKGDISTAGLVITDERVKAIDFSMNFVEDTFKLYHLSTYGNRFSDISIALYLKIFSCSVWLAAVALSLATVGLACLGDTLFLQHEETFGPFLLGIWFQTKGPSSSSCIRKKSSRILFLSIAFMNYIILSIYTAVLVA